MSVATLLSASHLQSCLQCPNKNFKVLIWLFSKFVGLKVLLMNCQLFSGLFMLSYSALTLTLRTACLTSTSQYLLSCSTVGSGHIMCEPKEVCQQIQMLATRTDSPVSGCVHVVWGEMVMTEMAGTVRASS